MQHISGFNRRQETGGEHRQALLRPEFPPEAYPKPRLCQADRQNPEPDRGACPRYLSKLPEHAPDQQPGDGPGQQTRDDGCTHLQSEKVPDL